MVSKMGFNSVEEAIKDIAKGKMIIVVDDKDRENEGDLVMAAGKVTPKSINFMIKHGRGLVCLPLDGKILDKLGIKEMASNNREQMRTAFTVSIDAHKRFGVTTGISVKDRATTIKIAVSNGAKADDLVSPGHIFPLRGIEGGVLRRAGHTEAAIDLAQIANLKKAGVICEIIKEDGSMARVPYLLKFAKKHKLKIITIASLIKYKMKTSKFVKQIAEFKLPTSYGDFKGFAYIDLLENKEHVALVKGNIENKKGVFVRVHSECLTGDVFSSKRCDCGEQLKAALSLIAKKNCGVFLYMRQEGRGIGLSNKLKAYQLQDKGADTVEANIRLGFGDDLRDYGVGAQILADLGLTSIKLITNNPRKIVGLGGYNIKVEKRIPLETKPNPHNVDYLKVKFKKLGHMLKV